MFGFVVFCLDGEYNFDRSREVGNIFRGPVWLSAYGISVTTVDAFSSKKCVSW